VQDDGPDLGTLSWLLATREGWVSIAALPAVAMALHLLVYALTQDAGSSAILALCATPTDFSPG